MASVLTATKEGSSTSVRNPEYVLTSLSSEECERIRLQKLQRVVTRAFGDRLSLSPVKLQPGDKVLDCGTGPGSWALDFASTVPKSIQIIGIDLDSGFFPPTPPENVTLKIESILDLPKEWTNKFQLIHQRLLMGSLTRDNWSMAIRELFRVTKPNGWVELCEVDDIVICPGHEGHKGLSTIYTVLQATNHQTSTALVLPQWLRDAGFVDVQIVEAELPLGKWAGKDGEANCETLVDGTKVLKTAAMELGGLGIAKSGEEFDALMDDLERILNETPGSKFKFTTVYGRKPS